MILIQRLFHHDCIRIHVHVYDVKIFGSSGQSMLRKMTEDRPVENFPGSHYVGEFSGSHYVHLILRRCSPEKC